MPQKNTVSAGKALKNLGKSHREIALRIGVGETMIAQWTTGRRPICIERALDIEDAFGLDADLLNPDIRQLQERLARRIQRKAAAVGADIARRAAEEKRKRAAPCAK